MTSFKDKLGKKLIFSNIIGLVISAFLEITIAAIYTIQLGKYQYFGEQLSLFIAVLIFCIIFAVLIMIIYVIFAD